MLFPFRSHSLISSHRSHRDKGNLTTLRVGAGFALYSPRTRMDPYQETSHLHKWCRWCVWQYCRRFHSYRIWPDAAFWERWYFAWWHKQSWPESFSAVLGEKQSFCAPTSTSMSGDGCRKTSCCVEGGLHRSLSEALAPGGIVLYPGNKVTRCGSRWVESAEQWMALSS